MKKIGRNDPCPCGSGRKFKHCHLGREDELEQEVMNDFSLEMSEKITRLPQVWYGRSREILDALDINKLTGSPMGIRFIDLKQYKGLDIFESRGEAVEGTGSIVINVLKTAKSDPHNLYIALSPRLADSTLIHQLAHGLDYLGGSKLLPGLAKPLSFDLGIPVEHLEHPHEFGYWLDYLQRAFDVELDADDKIILYLYQHDMLIAGEDIAGQNRLIVKSKSEQILRFLSEKSEEIDGLICELPGYIGSRVNKDE